MHIHTLAHAQVSLLNRFSKHAISMETLYPLGTRPAFLIGINKQQGFYRPNLQVFKLYIA